jgi:hypothetical protein
MGRILKSVAGFFTAAGAGINVATPSPGGAGSFAIDAFSSGKAYLEDIWANGATCDFIRFRSPRMHDVNQGLRLNTAGVQRAQLLPYEPDVQVYSSDTPTVEVDATGAGTQAVVVTYGYDDLSAGANLAHWSDIQNRIIDVAGLEVDVASSATIGTYGAAVGIDAFGGNLKADYEYAILGYICTVAITAACLTGVDTGNFDIAMPGNTDQRWTNNYFVRLSEVGGRPSIPIIAANNRAGTTLKAVDVAASTAAKFTLVAARLG